jgi:SAM-dependent methyltransferase
MLRDFLLSKISRRHMTPFIESHASNARTLEIGASDYYSEYFPNKVGLDMRPGPFVDVVGDAHELPFEDESFERILCTEVLEHLHTPQKAIDEMYRVLKKGGELILTTRFIAPIHDSPGDYFRFTKYGLSHLLKQWEIISIQEETTTAETFGHLLQRVAYQCDLRGEKMTKALLLFLAHCTAPLSWLIKREYGRNNDLGVYPEKAIMTAGYYVHARK